LTKIPRLLLILVLLPFSGGGAAARDWYISNASGMMLRPAFSRQALRQPYALAVDAAYPSAIPSPLRSFFEDSYAAELRTLYEEGKEKKRQWIFRDQNAVDRVVAVLEDDGYGFIEVYDGDGLLREDHQFGADGETAVFYSYNQGLLVVAELQIKDADGPAKDLWTDYYRYSRSGSLRAVDRVFYRDPAGENTLVRISFSRPALGAPKGLVDPGIAYGSEFFADIFSRTGDRVAYTADDQGRIIRELRQDAQGNPRGEFKNTWEGDRLVSVHWIDGEDDRLTEYRYDAAGERIFEQNHRRGTLERTVHREGDHDVEELYMNGRVILRALWRDGRKVSEESLLDKPPESPPGDLPSVPGGAE
jgi:hypothetical protein